MFRNWLGIISLTTVITIKTANMTGSRLVPVVTALETRFLWRKQWFSY